MADNSFEDFMENVMIPHYSNYKYNNPYVLRDIIAEKKLELKKQLDEKTGGGINEYFQTLWPSLRTAKQWFIQWRFFKGMKYADEDFESEE